MKVIVLIVLCTLLLGHLATAQAGGGVADGSYYADPAGNLVSVDVTDNPDATVGNCWVTVTDASGFSGAVDGAGIPCMNSAAMTTAGGTTYKVMNGYLFKKSTKGRWIRLKKVKAPPKNRHGGGGAATAIFIPWAGNEVVSLPGDPGG